MKEKTYYLSVDQDERKKYYLSVVQDERKDILFIC